MKLFEFLKDPKDNLSSKRLIGFICVITAICIAFIKGDPVLTGVFLGTAATIFGFQAVTGS